MTLYTKPDALPVPESTDDVTPLEDYFGNLSVATQQALLRPGSVNSDASRADAVPNPQPGQAVYRLDKSWREMCLADRLGGGLKWYPTEGLLPAVTASAAAAMTNVPANTATPLKFTTTTLLRGITYDVAKGQATIVQPGLYSVQGGARAGTTNADNRLVVTLNGVTYAGQQLPPSGVSMGAIAVTLPLAAGDVVSVDWFSGITQTPNTNQRFLSINYVCPA
ncbi:hypothetical protein HUN59_04610 [Curtobacterium sp. Csp2]|uniref:hypothetical protein n=1 Tax=Curtobacterium sp. Csp2 TaxID=2495430 RepID=UPI00158087CF|nr:hypothetical protein [Curtobacterium sp. Csp2]QKS15593.1 hypothetical protein HUN59_04610 [Curtobacterium sp. Csp2]